MPDCRGVEESRIYLKRAKKSPFAGFVPQSGITDSSRHIKISRKHQIFICHVTIQAHNRPLRKPEFLAEASNSARKQTQYIQNNKKI